jgi:di/tricarboxylate transporter
MELFGMPWEILFMYGLLVAVFISFVLERIPPDLTAMAALCALIAVGILGPQDALGVFSNSAPITILAMFIISAALERTGCIELLGRSISKISGKNEVTLLLAVMPIALIISAFMNNTPVVVVLTPVLISLARKMQLAPSKVLIPLSYAAVMGGTCTLIGTSTNLLVNGIAVESGLETFGMFDITLPGLMMAGVGFTYLLLIGRFMLPDRLSVAGLLGEAAAGKKYIAQMLVPADSKLIGQEVFASSLSKGGDTEVIDVIRHGDSMRDYLKELTLKAGDRVVIETNAREILGISESNAVEFEKASIEDLSTVSTAENVVVEAIVSRNSNLLGRLVGGLGFRRKYGVYVMGVHKTDRTYFYRPTSDILEAGDTLLLEGPADGMKRLLEENDLVNLTFADDRPIRRHKAPIAMVTLGLVVGLAALNIMPIVTLALVGAIFVVLTGCLDAKDMYKTVDWPILFLIFGMLGVSMGMEKTGAAQLIVEQVVALSEKHGPFVLLAGIYILTSILTEIISNNAIATLLTPIVIGVTTTMGLNPVPFLVAVMFGASASFATPIGYQTNTFVYGAGGYKFRDFLVVGAPLNVIMFAVAMYAIPKFWSF